MSPLGQALTAAVGGQAQALLLNYEEEPTGQFGADSSLATQLRFPVFIGSFPGEGERTLRRLRAQLPAACAPSSPSTTPVSTSRSPGIPLRVSAARSAGSGAEGPMRSRCSTRFDDLDEEQRAAVEAIGKKGLVVVRERKRGVIGHGYLKASSQRPERSPVLL